MNNKGLMMGRAWLWWAVLLVGGAVLLVGGAGAAEPPRLVLDARGHTAIVRKVLFTPEGRELITVSEDKTIRLWDVASGEPLRTLRTPIGDGKEGTLYAAAISPNGEWLAVGGFGFQGGNCHVYLISLSQMQVVRLLKGHSNVVFDLAFSADGKRLISGGGDNTARVWRVVDGACEFVLRGHNEEIYGVAFAPDGLRCATASLDDTAAIWLCQPSALASGNSGGSASAPREAQRLAVLRGHRDDVMCVAWSPDGRRIATGSIDHTIRLWDVGQAARLPGTAEPPVLRTFDQLGERRILSVTFTADSQRLLFTHGTGSGKRLAGLLDVPSGKTVVEFDKHTNVVMHGALSRDGLLAATTGGNDSETWIWKCESAAAEQAGKGPRLAPAATRLVGVGRVPWSAAWSPDGNTIAWGNTTNSADTIATKQPLERAFEISNLQLSNASPAAFLRAQPERGGTQLKSSGRTTVDVLRGGQKQTTLQFTTDYERKVNRVNCFTLLSGERAAVGADFGLSLFDTRTGKQLREFQGHTGAVWAVSTSPDGRYLLSAAGDMTLRVWDPDRELSLFFAGDDWVAWTPEGYYAASPGGERLMGWQLNNGPDKLASFLPASQFRPTFYRPDLIKLLLKTGSVERALAEADTARGRMTEKTEVAEVLPPTVVIASPEGGVVTADSGEITVRAVAQQVGKHPITSMQLLLDGRPMGGKTGIKKFDSPQRQVTERFFVPLEPGVKHTLQVRADSAVSYGVSGPVEVTFKKPDTQAKLPSLYVLAIGVKDYEKPELSLRFADEDARRIDRVFRERGAGLFQKVETKLIVNKEATRRGVLSGLSWLKQQMTQHDVGIVFYSGHGDKDSDGTFFLLPHDVDPADLSSTGVPDTELKRVLQAIPSRVVLMLDACNAGAAGGDKRKGGLSLTDDLVRDLATDDYGVIVMASSTGREFSLESSDLKSGYFALALTEGLSGKADANADKVVYSNELDAYVSDRVKSLSKGQQHPVTAKPGTVRSFPMARQ